MEGHLTKDAARVWVASEKLYILNNAELQGQSLRRTKLAASLAIVLGSVLPKSRRRRADPGRQRGLRHHWNPAGQGVAPRFA